MLILDDNSFSEIGEIFFRLSFLSDFHNDVFDRLSTYPAGRVSHLSIQFGTIHANTLTALQRGTSLRIQKISLLVPMKESGSHWFVQAEDTQASSSSSPTVSCSFSRDSILTRNVDRKKESSHFLIALAAYTWQSVR